MQARHVSLSELYSREYGSLHRLVARKLGSHSEAEDVVQDAYVRMLTMPADHPTLDNPKAFLFTVASNLVVDTIRREQRLRRMLVDACEPQAVPQGDQAEIVCPNRSTEEQVDTSLRLRRVLEALRELPVQCRRAFVLHKFHELPYAQVAREMGVSVSMVEKHLSRALQHLRNHRELFDA